MNSVVFDCVIMGVVGLIFLGASIVYYFEKKLIEKKFSIAPLFFCALGIVLICGLGARLYGYWECGQNLKTLSANEISVVNFGSRQILKPEGIQHAIQCFQTGEWYSKSRHPTSNEESGVIVFKDGRRSVEFAFGYASDRQGMFVRFGKVLYWCDGLVTVLSVDGCIR